MQVSSSPTPIVDMPQDLRYSLLADEDDDAPSIRNTQGKGPGRRIEYLFLAVAIFSLLVSLASFTYTYTRLPRQSNSRRLEIVSQYIGLDRAVYQEDSPILPPILNYPSLITRINASEPTKPSQESYLWDSTFGTIYLQKRLFIVSSEVSTVVQFRAGDFGFENCTLRANLPPDPGAKSVPDNAYAVDIWRLDALHMVRADSVTWNTRPKRVSRLANWSLRPGQQLESSPFYCPWGSFHTFEFAGTSDVTRFQFIQDATEHERGILLRQSQGAQPK